MLFRSHIYSSSSVWLIDIGNYAVYRHREDDHPAVIYDSGLKYWYEMGRRVKSENPSSDKILRRPLANS